MADELWVQPRIREAFYHEKLGVILVCDELFGTGERAGKPHGDVFYLRTLFDGQGDDLTRLRADLMEHWADGSQPTFSLN